MAVGLSAGRCRPAALRYRQGMTVQATGTELAAADGTLVVRTGEAWLLTPARGHDALPVDFDELLALVGDDPTTLAPERRAELSDAGVLVPGGGVEVAPNASTPVDSLPGPLDEGTVLEPHAATVARIDDRTLVVESTTGEPVALDPVDLHLLDAIDRWMTAAEVLDAVMAGLGATAPDRTLLARRLARMADTGRVRVARRPPPVTRDVTATGDPAATTDDAGPATPPPVVGPAPVTPPPARWWARRRARRPPLSTEGEATRSPRPPDQRSPADPAHPAPTAEFSADASDDLPVTASDTTTVTPEGGAAYGGRAPGEAAVPFEYLDDPFPGGPAGPVPVYAVWPVETGPVLALGMLTAAARHHDHGRLAAWYEIRRQEEPTSFFTDLAARNGPAVVLLSNYVWSLGRNLALARRVRDRCPGAVIIHGGPSTPKYPGDVEEFFALHGDLVDLTVRGEGEATLVAALEALGPSFPKADLDRLRDVPGLSFRDPATATVVRTPDRDRIADLDTLPSPYLTGEFDHLPTDAWNVPSGLLGLIFESNRGCPYGCTFCDWGSSTLSRIRKFDMARVDAEMRWAAERGLHAWTITDANFGIIARDVEIAERMGALRKELGNPRHFGFNVAKNTTKHLTAILDRLVEAGIIAHFSLAMQTRDEATLEAVERTNISTDHYLALAAAFRRRGLPLDADVMVGLPGQTLDSFSEDLQFCIDHEVPARMWITELLPNAPMNEPGYRARWAIEADEHHVVVASASFTREDRRLMMRLRHAYTAFERFGILRHVVRYAQWDHGVPAMSVIRRIVEVSEEDPDRYPLLNWVSRYFDHFNVVPLGWRAFFAEVAEFLTAEFAIGPSPARTAVLDAQAFLLPDVGRRFPDSLPLAHDLVSYHRDHTRGLWADGTPRRGGVLESYGPTVLTAFGDPLGSCDRGMAVNEDPRNEVLTERFWIVGHWEIDSPLVSNVPEVAAAADAFIGLREARPADLADETLPDPGAPGPTRVALGARTR